MKFRRKITFQLSYSNSNTAFWSQDIQKSHRTYKNVTTDTIVHTLVQSYLSALLFHSSTASSGVSNLHVTGRTSHPVSIGSAQ